MGTSNTRHFVRRSLRSLPPKRESRGSNHHIADNFSTENFVAGFDIRKIVIGEQVGKKGDEAVGQIMAEIKDARGPTHKETRTVNHICLAVQNRLKSHWGCPPGHTPGRHPARHDIAGRGGETGLEGFGFSTVRRMADHPYPGLDHDEFFHRRAVSSAEPSSMTITSVKPGTYSISALSTATIVFPSL